MTRNKRARQIIIDYVRRRSAGKRGGGEKALPLEEEKVPVDHQIERLLALDEALEKLGADNPVLLQVVECRFYAGLSVDETSEALSISKRSVERHWQNARTALKATLGSG